MKVGGVITPQTLSCRSINDTESDTSKKIIPQNIGNMDRLN